ncbi:hypothetical protein AB1N83_010487 [Pleurotus pulmonarius]
MRIRVCQNTQLLIRSGYQEYRVVTVPIKTFHRVEVPMRHLHGRPAATLSRHCGLLVSDTRRPKYALQTSHSRHAPKRRGEAISIASYKCRLRQVLPRQGPSTSSSSFSFLSLSLFLLALVRPSSTLHLQVDPTF